MILIIGVPQGAMLVAHPDPKLVG